MRLDRAGVGDTVRADVLQRAERGGLVDDARSRSVARGNWRSGAHGDVLIGDDLVRQGLDEAVARTAVSRPEPERGAAHRDRRAPRRSARNAALPGGKGFSEDALEGLIADIGSGG